MRPPGRKRRLPAPARHLRLLSPVDVGTGAKPQEGAALPPRLPKMQPPRLTAALCGFAAQAPTVDLVRLWFDYPKACYETDADISVR